MLTPATVTGTCAAAGKLLAPLEEAITARSRDSWHLHADETSWHVFSPDEGDGPAKWWLWVFIGPDTTCFVMDPTRAGAVLARHAGIDEETGQLADDGDGPLGAYPPVLRARRPGPADVLDRRVGWTGSRHCTRRTRS